MKENQAKLEAKLEANQDALAQDVKDVNKRLSKEKTNRSKENEHLRSMVLRTPLGTL